MPCSAWICDRTAYNSSRIGFLDIGRPTKKLHRRADKETGQPEIAEHAVHSRQLASIGDVSAVQRQKVKVLYTRKRCNGQMQGIESSRRENR